MSVVIPDPRVIFEINWLRAILKVRLVTGISPPEDTTMHLYDVSRRRGRWRYCAFKIVVGNQCLKLFKTAIEYTQKGIFQLHVIRNTSCYCSLVASPANTLVAIRLRLKCSRDQGAVLHLSLNKRASCFGCLASRQVIPLRASLFKKAMPAPLKAKLTKSTWCYSAKTHL